MPGAIASGTPMSDVTKVGDTFYTMELVDNVLCRATASATRVRRSMRTVRT